jgi:hypothetical protein
MEKSNEGGSVVNRRQSIIDKCKALLRKTIENGATEAEMLSALAKVQALQDSYEIKDADLEEAKDEAVKLIKEAGEQALDPGNIKWHMSYSVGKFCNVQLYRDRGSKALTLIGTKSDVDWAMWLLEHLADFVHQQLADYLFTEASLAPRSDLRSIKANFVQAACGTISDRLNALGIQSEVNRTPNGRALMVIKSGAVKAYLKEHGISLCCGGGGGPSNFHEGAQAAGRAAGGRATFGRPVTGAAGAARIGKG